MNTHQQPHDDDQAGRDVPVVSGARVVDQDQLAAILADARAKAEAATPGPWRDSVLGSEGYAVTGPQGSAPGKHRLHAPQVARCGREDWDTDKANAAHIARMDPETTLLLLDAVETLQTENERLRLDWEDEDARRITAEAEAADLRDHLAEGHDPLNSPSALAHIARMDPETTLLLLDAVETLQAENERLDARRRAAWAEANDAMNRAEAAEAEETDLRTRLANVRHEVETYREAMPAFSAIYSDHRDVLTKEAQRRAHLALTYPRAALDGPQDGKARQAEPDDAHSVSGGDGR